MIIVKLSGGLGNQMFQYATARALSGNRYVYFDYSFLKNNHTSSKNFTARKYELPIFKYLKCKNINTYFLRLILSKNKKYSFIKKFLPPKFKNISYVNDSNISEVINKSNSNAFFYLDGYFQNPIYFEKIRSTIIKDFTFPKINIELKRLQFEIENSNSIAIHIRRGDYLNPNINDFHGILPISYYQNAINYFDGKIDKPNYFIFSDDPNWCKENLTFFENKKTVSEGYNAWVDMYLISKCKHQIIANSSFSWWGAWLNQNQKKIVIAPKRWFVEAETNIIPEEWISL